LAIESKKGKKRFNGVICVATDSSINSLSDLKGKTFAFGSETSTIGRYLAQMHLSNEGINASHLKSYKYLGRHDRVGKAVALKQFDAGALKESTYKKLVAKGNALKVIKAFPNVTKPWIARKGLSDKVSKAIQAVLLELQDKTILKSLGKDGFLKGNDADYAEIRTSMNENISFFSGN